METFTEQFIFYISYRNQDMLPAALLLKNDIIKNFYCMHVILIEEYLEKDLTQGNAVSINTLIQISHAVIFLIDNNWMPNRKSTLIADSEVKGEYLIDTSTQQIIQEFLLAQQLPLTYNHSYNGSCDLSKRVIIPLFINCAPIFEQFMLPVSLCALAQIPSECIYYNNWSSSIYSLLLRLTVRSNMQQVLNCVRYTNKIKNNFRPLNDIELMQALVSNKYQGWVLNVDKVENIQNLSKKFKFSTFKQAINFIQQVSEYCELINHHPDWQNIYQSVSVMLSTHDAQNRITQLDLNLASFMNSKEISIINT